MWGQPATCRGGWTGLQVNSNGAAANGVTTELISILATIEVPLVVVRRDRTMAAFNQAAADALGLSLPDIGRTLRDISVLARVPRLEQHCAEVITGGVESRIDFRDGEAWFVVRISPYTRCCDQMAGAVLTFTDLTAFSAAIAHAIYELVCTKALLDTAADPPALWGADQPVQSGNRSFSTMFGVSPDPTEPTSVYELGNGAFDSAPVRTQLQAAVATLSLENLREVLAGTHA